MSRYSVVFNKTSVGKKGILTWRSWGSEEEFEKWLKSEERDEYLEKQEVLEIGRRD